MRINPKALKLQPRVSSCTFIKKKAEVIFMIPKTDFEIAIQYLNEYDSSKVNSDWEEFLAYMKDKYVSPTGMKIKFRSPKANAKAYERGLELANEAIIQQVAFTDEAISFITYVDTALKIDFTNLKLHPKCDDMTYRPYLLNITYKIKEDDFYSAAEKLSITDIDYAWDVFSYFLMSYYDLRNSTIDGIGLNAHAVSERASEDGLEIDVSTLSIAHAEIKDNYIEVEMTCTCKKKEEKTAKPLSIPDDSNFEWTKELLSRLDYTLKISSTRTGKNLRFTCNATKTSFLKALQTASISASEKQIDIMYAAFVKYLDNINEVEDLSKLNLTKDKLSDYAYMWGYEDITSMTLRKNTSDELSFIITLTSNKEMLIPDMTDIEAPIIITEEDDRIECIILKTHFAFSAEPKGIDIDIGFSYLARCANNCEYDKLPQIFTEEWKESICSKLKATELPINKNMVYLTKQSIMFYFKKEEV